MTVAELMAELKKLPKDAEVGFPNMEIDQIEPVRACRLISHIGYMQVVIQ